MRILVTGSRVWPDSKEVQARIVQVIVNQPYGTHVVVVHGDCPTGADRAAREFLDDIEKQNLDYISQETHPADWNKHGKAAGPLRNQEMVDLGADVCLAFPLGESRGTRDCMRRAEAAGIPVINYGENRVL